MAVLPTAEYLMGRPWKFHHGDGSVASPRLTFLPDGTIGGYDHRNERRWRIEAGALLLLNGQGTPTARLDQVTSDGDIITVCGPHLPIPHITLCITEQAADASWKIIPGSRHEMAARIDTHHWDIGAHSYGNPVTFEDGWAKLKIGRFTSIAANVFIALADHRVECVSTYPFPALRAFWPSAPPVPDHRAKGDVVIGNDVWIGARAFIGSGVTIGDGAVIGAHAVVTRDVPPYAIVVGNPGHIARYRFSESVIAQLLQIAWWDWPEPVIDAYLPRIMSDDIEGFIAYAIADGRGTPNG